MKYVIIVAVFYAIMCAGFPSPASASSITLKSYLSNQDENFKVYTNIWIDGVYNGFLVANSELKSTDKGQLFCVPRNTVMSTDQIESILDGYIAKYKLRDKLGADFAITTLLGAALQENFPCR